MYRLACPCRPSRRIQWPERCGSADGEVTQVSFPYLSDSSSVPSVLQLTAYSLYRILAPPHPSSPRAVQVPSVFIQNDPFLAMFSSFVLFYPLLIYLLRYFSFCFFFNSHLTPKCDLMKSLPTHHRMGIQIRIHIILTDLLHGSGSDLKGKGNWPE